MPELSVIVPTFNERANSPYMVDALAAALILLISIYHSGQIVQQTIGGRFLDV